MTGVKGLEESATVVLPGTNFNGFPASPVSPSNTDSVDSEVGAEADTGLPVDSSNIKAPGFHSSLVRELKYSVQDKHADIKPLDSNRQHLLQLESAARHSPHFYEMEETERT